jgi:hypothetical protein
MCTVYCSFLEHASFLIHVSAPSYATGTIPKAQAHSMMYADVGLKSSLQSAPSSERKREKERASERKRERRGGEGGGEGEGEGEEGRGREGGVVLTRRQRRRRSAGKGKTKVRCGGDGRGGRCVRGFIRREIGVSLLSVRVEPLWVSEGLAAETCHTQLIPCFGGLTKVEVNIFSCGPQKHN